jgi:(p)ppGpp synthase/HD superfamily hydrolase
MSTLERAIVIAAEAHAGQIDKGGAPYILHPLRVMFRLHSPEERIAAVLHDVVEDSDWTLDRLRAEGFAEGVVAAVDHLTKREGEAYEAYIARAGRHPVARAVKVADLLDNLDLSRIAVPSERDEARIERYRRAIIELQAVEAAARRGA